MISTLTITDTPTGIHLELNKGMEPSMEPSPAKQMGFVLYNIAERIMDPTMSAEDKAKFKEALGI